MLQVPIPKNSIAFWDNRCVQHYAVFDYFPAVRSGDRVTVKGDKPFYKTNLRSANRTPQPNDAPRDVISNQAILNALSSEMINDSRHFIRRSRKSVPSSGLPAGN